MHREILLVSLVDVITNPQFRHHVEPRVGRSKIDEDPEAPFERRSVNGLTAEPLSRAGLPAPALRPLRLDLDRNPVGVVAIAREHVDAWHVACERNRISASAVYLGSHEELPGTSHLLVGQPHWSRSSSFDATGADVGSAMMFPPVGVPVPRKENVTRAAVPRSGSPAKGDDAILVFRFPLDRDLVACAKVMPLEEFVPMPVPEPEDLVVGNDVGLRGAGEPFEVQCERSAELALPVRSADRIFGEEVKVPRQVDVVVVEVALGE